MKKLIYLAFLAIGMTGCSVESIDSTENLVTADMKIKMQEAKDPMGFYSGPNLKGTLSVWNDCDNLYVEITPTGEDPTEASLGVFADGAFPETSGGSGNIKTDGFTGLDSATDLVWTIPLNEATSFNIFIKAWSNWAGTETSEDFNQNYTAYTVDYSECGDCEESFSYEPNGDGSYTFTYIPEEDMEDAEVVFTFAQGTIVSGYDWVNWNGNSSTRTEKMNLEACETYSWTVTLVPDCSGEGNKKGNVWTDFKVNDISKKGDSTPNIELGC